MNNKERINELKKLLSKCAFYQRIGSRLSFDQECICPKNGLEIAASDADEIYLEIFKIKHSKKFINLVKELYSNKEGLNEYEVILVDNLYEDYSKNKNVTQKMQLAMNNASSKCYIKWLDAKEKKDYELFKPYFKEVINCTKKIYLSRDEQKETLYDTIIDDYEKGWNTKRYDDFFNKLKEEIVPLVKKISKSKKKIRNDFLSRSVPIYKQEEFSKFLLVKEGHSFDNLVLMTTEHPFTSKISEGDERVTTHYYENNFLSNVYSIMHEGGHALFDLNEPKEFADNYINQNMTMAMHECMSRLFENMVSRSESFVHLIYPKFKELFKEEFNDVSELELYEASNIAIPSLNRCDADELTYCLHIIIRYELEKEFINGKTNVNGLNKKWNKLYKEYLGVDVPDDKEGILQDVHWTGTYGYFPTYALGSAYAVQIYNKMNQEFDIEQAIENDQVIKIVDWLRNNAWKYASIMDPDEWIFKVTGEEFNPQYYIDYLKNKYKKLYEIRD